MNIEKIVNIEGPLEEEALSILRDVPGVTAGTSKSGDQADVLLHAGDVTHIVEVKTRRTTNAAVARQLIDDARLLPGGCHLLVVARTTTEDARRILQEAGIAIIDAGGNIRLELPGLFVWTDSHPGLAREKQQAPPVRLTGKAGVAAQALLREPERPWRVNDLAKAADVSVGLAHRVLARLERDSLVVVQGAGPQRTRHVTNATALLDLWAEEMVDRRVKRLGAYRLARDPRAQASALSRQLVEAGVDHAVTGAAAAARLAPFVTAIPVTEIWVTGAAALTEVAETIRADIVDDGHNVLLRNAAGDAPLAFRTLVEDVWTVSPFRLYLDLRQDPRRGREQADRLRQEVIQF